MSYLETTAGIFGDGADGDFTLTGDYTQPSQKRWNNLNVGNFNYKPNGWITLVKGIVTIGMSGSINDNGNHAVANTQGAGLSARNQMDAQGGAGGAGYSLSSITAGNGIAGSSTTGATGAGSVYNDAGVLPSGGASGASTTRSSGAGGTAPHIGGGFAKLGQATPWSGRHSNGFLKGGGGGAGGALTNIIASLTVAGGGGGGGGGVCLVANQIVNGNIISANGGNGGSASSTDPASNNAGGGGGGGGGWVMITTNTPASILGAVTANGGTQGTGAGTGGQNGVAGNAGSVFIVSFGGN